MNMIRYLGDGTQVKYKIYVFHIYYINKTQKQFYTTFIVLKFYFGAMHTLKSFRLQNILLFSFLEQDALSLQPLDKSSAKPHVFISILQVLKS